jgi:N-acetyl-gamma-glutamyl-phosphate reductase
MVARIFIDGEAGTTGLSLARRLRAAPGVALVGLSEAMRKDVAARREAMAAADLVVLCLPDAAAREAALLAETLPQPPKLLDASTAHRIAPGWVYGLPELGWRQAHAVAAARKVANPGCYATGAILLLRPLIEAGILPAQHDVTINAVSGYSGGGKAMIAAHQADGGPAFELYALGLNHKHVPEIMAHGGLTRRPIFTPSVGHFAQGMLVSVPLFLDALPGRPGLHDLMQVYAEFFAGARRVAVARAGETLEPEALNDTDRLEIFLAGDSSGTQAVLMARLDNLGKGAAGAAVQNIALMLGLPEPEPVVEEAG